MKSRTSVDTIRLAVDVTCMCSILKFIAQKLSPPNPYHALVIAMPAAKAAQKAAPKAVPRAVSEKQAARAVIKKPAAAKQRTKAKRADTMKFEAGVYYKHA